MVSTQKLEERIQVLEARVKKLEDILSSSGFVEEKAVMDAYYQKAKAVVIREQKASAIFLQRKLLIDLDRATRLIQELERNGVIGPENGFEPRKVLVKE